ncbi:sensor domain-containing diguanylate cyclase [Phaeobacter italicus]|uniref:sensor domain-containing diguanylate cyclase n=1 Tax=Phaeobacter italicus TaxID=481446 RepID=UPI000186F794|nr:sensor domain-containing diguanylate cyclase [Phaeobacter italicus]EEB70694.1 diguanylate cyclase, putative [Ruegeria sp. R11]CRL13688.1 Stalked cell differentiation-controlling protein [Phaeobacter italicus]SFG01734.1 diguanylate cyclase (GGDEF) domain-containing protein [Phaeobacter italicus]
MSEKFRNTARQNLKWVSVAAMLATVAAGSAWGVYKLPAPIVDAMLEADIRKQAELWRRRVVLHLEHAEATFITGYVNDEDAKYLTLMPEASDVYRLKLFDETGHVFWSTRIDDVGTQNENAYFAAQVMQGVTYYKQVEKPATEIDGLNLHSTHVEHATPHNVAEIYTPISDNGRVVGAVEFYTDVTTLRGTFITRVRMLLGALSTLGLLAMGLVSLVIFRTNQKQMRALSRKSDHERKLMDEQLRLAREVKLLGELNEWLQSSRSLDELFDMVSKFMTHILPNAEGSVYVYSNSRDVLDGWASWNGGDHKDHIHPDSCWGLRRGRVYEYGSGEVTFVCEHAEPHDGRPYFCFPILAHGETVGLMHLRAHSADCENFAANKKLARMCAEQISMAISNVQMRDQLHDQSVRDPLTGLFNRRHMTDSLRKGISRCQSQGSRLSLIAIDVDHFKKFNDNHGHDAGDMVLRAVGSVLEQACDGDEVACRPGGEEFTLILPDTTPEDALTRAELVRQAVEEVTVRYGEKALPRVTISIGVSHYPSHGTMPQDLMRAADEALYEAKGRGRNQVYVANQNDSVITPVEGTAETPGKKPDAA